MKFNAGDKVLIVAPHTDDGELGLGGTMAMLADQQLVLGYVALSLAEKSLPEGFPVGTTRSELGCATKKLGVCLENLFIYDFEVRRFSYSRQEILDALIEVRRKFKPDIIFIPSLTDIHQDHQVAAAESQRAFRNSTLIGYELPWNSTRFAPNYFVSLDLEYVNKKIESLGCYKSQSTKDYMGSNFIMSLAITRGVQVGKKLAEAFEIIKCID